MTPKFVSGITHSCHVVPINVMVFNSDGYQYILGATSNPCVLYPLCCVIVDVARVRLIYGCYPVRHLILPTGPL